MDQGGARQGPEDGGREGAEVEVMRVEKVSGDYGVAAKACVVEKGLEGRKGGA